MKYLLLILLSFNSLFALELKNLLQDIKQDAKKELQAEQKRISLFLDNKQNQKDLLNKAKNDLRLENLRSQRLKNTIDENEKNLAVKEEILALKMGDLGEMFGSVRQTSSDFSTNFAHALTASQYPQKVTLFKEFANSQKLPNLQKLKNFWHAMLEEIAQSGNIVSYETDIILNSGEKAYQEVTRVGLFSAVSQGKYLAYSNDMNSLIELSTQPGSNAQDLAKDFQEGNNQISNILIDPTRGMLFEMLNNKPTLMDRIHQGGLVGYIIIFLGFLGLVVAFYKMLVLNLSHNKINAQMQNIKNPLDNNSLGKIAEVFYKNQHKSLVDLETKISEVILKEINHIKQGQSFVKLLSAVTPLLGLLGTVTGMITTFQAITLFGTGDPKLMAGGISTALITTVLGLVTAIPLLFAYTYISSKADAIVSILEEQSVGLLAKNIENK